MKSNTLILVLFLLGVTGNAQTTTFQLPARQNPTVKKENLSKVVYVNDLSPLLWSSMALPLKGDFWLPQRRVNNFAQPQPENYLYPQDDYKQILDVVYLKIAAVCNGKTVAAVSTSDKLSTEQKDILNTADLSTDIHVTIRYKYKDQTKDSYGSRNKIVEGSTAVTIVPAIEAEYPGGLKQLSAYFAGNVLNKITEPAASDKIYQAVVKFTVNEDGQIINAKLARTSSDKHIDYLLMEALNKMPKWKPAENANGMKVKQEISIPFSAGC